MFKNIIVSFFCIFIFIFSAHAANTTQVEITVMASGVSVPSQEVWLNYSDGQSAAGTTLKAMTDAQGKVVFQVPTIIYPQDTVFLSVPSLNTNVRGRPYLIRPLGATGVVSLVITPMNWALLQ